MAVALETLYLQVVVVTEDPDDISFFIIPHNKETREVCAYLTNKPDTRLFIKENPTTIELSVLSWFTGIIRRSNKTGFYVDELTKTTFLRGMNANLSFAARKFMGIRVFYDYK
jgi:hypothetical protein